MPKRGKGLCGKGSCDNLSGLERKRGNASVRRRAKGWRSVSTTLGGDFDLMFWPSVWAWRERRVCWPQPHGRTEHPGQSSTGWRTMTRHRAVATRSGLAVCPGSWRLGQVRAGQRGRPLQAADTRFAPDSVLLPDFLLHWRAGRTMRGCPHRRFRARRQREPTSKRPEGLRRQSP